MKSIKNDDKASYREGSVDVDALLAAINEISESEVKRADNAEDPHRVSVDGRAWYTYSELAEAFELDIYDFSISQVNK